MAPYAPMIDMKIRSVACGDGFFLAVNDAGKVYSWGNGRYFRLGHGDTVDQSTPKLVQALAAEEIRLVAAGDCHRCENLTCLIT